MASKKSYQWGQKENEQWWRNNPLIGAEKKKTERRLSERDYDRDEDLRGRQVMRDVLGGLGNTW